MSEQYQTNEDIFRPLITSFSQVLELALFKLTLMSKIQVDFKAAHGRMSLNEELEPLIGCIFCCNTVRIACCGRNNQALLDMTEEPRQPHGCHESDPRLKWHPIRKILSSI